MALLLTSGCGGGGGGREEEQAEEEQASEDALLSQDALNAALEQSFSESGAPGVIAAVQTPEDTWVGTLGVADLSSEEPMLADMHQRIGSVNKTFTVSLLLQAEADGLLSLDDTIEQYVEGVPNGDEITLRQMANMTSGIASYTFNEQWQDALFSDPRRIWRPEELVQYGIADSPAFDPGTDFQYSNTNTVLLGLVLEQVSGEPIGDLYREGIIEPLGLRETSFPNADPAFPDPHPQGYTLQGQDDGEPVTATDWNPSWGWTAGAMISTVDDLLVYGRALGTGDGLLPPEQQAERLDSFLSDDLPPNSADRAYGLGLGREYGWLGHTGELPGFNTAVYYHPELDATVVVEVNSDIPSGDCPPDRPTMTNSPHENIPCEDPAVRIFAGLAEALGQPFGPEQ
ncbi:MAG TPA: serine hydrolase domain-containing protein [Rubrobacteraceae bacterium]|nr:serine hydrolase domain-containing protein [Rubrobacteraceae bacterium]